MENYRVTYVSDQARLAALAGGIESLGALALDIETAEWWDRQRERVSLVRRAYRREGELRVAVVDALAPIDPAALRRPLEQGPAVKAVHNAAYDAARLARLSRLSV